MVSVALMNGYKDKYLEGREIQSQLSNKIRSSSRVDDLSSSGFFAKFTAQGMRSLPLKGA